MWCDLHHWPALGEQLLEAAGVLLKSPHVVHISVRHCVLPRLLRKRPSKPSATQQLTGGSGTLYSTEVKVTTAGVKGSAVRCL